MQFPIITVIVLTPLATGLVLFLLPGEKKNLIRYTALAASVVDLVLSFWVYLSYDLTAGGYQFVQQFTWMPRLGISYHVGVNGLNAPLVLLTGVVMFTGVLISWGIDDRPREFFAFLFILATGVFGVFVSLDMFMLFFFYEEEDPGVRCNEAYSLLVHRLDRGPGWRAGDVLCLRAGQF
ncbi:MAG: hypothetical protein P8Y34_06345 [Anaerolineales bacterium]